MLTQKIDIYIESEALTPEVEVVQGDSGRILRCRIIGMEIPDGCTARLYAEKPSGLEVYNDCTVLWDCIETKLTTQIIAEAGTVKCQIELLQENNRVTSFDFHICVAKGRVNDSAIESKDEFTALENALDEAHKSIGIAEDAAETATTAANAANTASQKANEATNKANVATTAANTAAQKADEAREEIETKLSAGELSASVTVGTTKTSEPGGNAEVINSGNNKDMVLDFTIPRGPAGPPGSLENLDDQPVTFTEAQEYETIVSGDAISTLFGKIKKLFSRINNNVIADKKNGVISIPVVATGYIGSNKTGKLIVKLPQGFVGTMIKFTVEILERYGKTFAEYDILGQIYAGGGGSWATLSTATCRGIGSNMELPVSFGKEGDNAAIAIGSDDTAWGVYSAIKIKDVTAYFTHFDVDEWASGWDISIGVPTGTYTKTVQTKTGVSVNSIFPIGYVMISADPEFDPNTAYAGTSWERFGTGKTLIGWNEDEIEFKTVGKTGGEKTHVLTTDEIPAHDHELSGAKAASSGAHTHSVPNTGNGVGGSAVRAESFANASDSGRTLNTSSSGAHTHNVSGTITSTGGDSAHNNLPPYVVVVFWKRIG